ncbi:MAG TPA: thioredoxin domain-containing protein [bacterium]|nr:thioredoxin domain-containing protein [bacterium]
MPIDREELAKHLSADENLDEQSRLQQYAAALPDEPMIVSNVKYKKRRWFTKWWGVLLIMLFLTLAIFTSMFVYFYKDFLNKMAAGTIQWDMYYQGFDFKTRYDLLAISRDTMEDDPWWGHPDAKVVIVEFGDYTCSYCRDFNNKIMPQLKDKYQNDVLFIYRDFPVLSGAEGASVQVANVANCVYNNLNDKADYWKVVHNYLFLMTDNLGNIHKDLEGYYNVEAAEKCINDKMFYNEVLRDFNQADELGLTSTPSFFVNGHYMQGSLEAEEWFYVIDKFLAANQ